jgi:hypothetical protein
MLFGVLLIFILVGLDFTILKIINVLQIAVVRLSIENLHVLFESQRLISVIKLRKFLPVNLLKEFRVEVVRSSAASGIFLSCLRMKCCIPHQPERKAPVQSLHWRRYAPVRESYSKFPE